jgi:cytochrome c556
MKPAVAVATALAVVGAYSAVVLAQGRPDVQIKYRQGVMNAVGYHFYGVLGGMAKGDRPYDAQAAARSATFIDQLLQMPWDGFTPGSDTGAPTKAKPEIWKDRAKFDNHMKEAQAETAKLAKVAGTDLATMRPQVQATAKACSNCHDEFRAK